MPVLFTLLRALFARLWPFLLDLGAGLLKSGAKWGLALSVAGLLGFTDAGKEILLWGFDSLLTVLDYCVGLIILPNDLTQFSFQSLFNSLPGQLIGLLGYCGIPQGLSIIAAALTVRFMRDLLHF